MRFTAFEGLLEKNRSAHTHKYFACFSPDLHDFSFIQRYKTRQSTLLLFGCYTRKYQTCWCVRGETVRIGVCCLYAGLADLKIASGTHLFLLPPCLLQPVTYLSSFWLCHMDTCVVYDVVRDGN